MARHRALDTIADLLATVERLPEPRRSEVRARVADAIAGPAPLARLALGALALELLDDQPIATTATTATTATATRRTA
jgi:hypothetical protein